MQIGWTIRIYVYCLFSDRYVEDLCVLRNQLTGFYSVWRELQVDKTHETLPSHTDVRDFYGIVAKP